MKEDVMMSYLLSVGELNAYHSIVVLGAIIVLGLFTGKLVEKIKIPYITGYILSGLFIGGLLVAFGIKDIVHSLEVVSSVGLGFIAYGIGRELVFSRLKKTGKEVIVITITQAVITTVLVAGGLMLLGISVPVSLIFGAIATATEPASIMLLTKKFRTNGPLTKTLIPLVGLDDAVGIVIFGVLLSVAKSLEKGLSLSFIKIIEEPFFELLFSLVVGIIFGLIVSQIIKYTKSNSDEKYETYLALSVFAVLVTVGLAKMGLHIGDFPIHLSPILTPMIMGVTITNRITRVQAQDMELAVDKFTPPILIAFFTIAGAELVIAFFGEADVVMSLVMYIALGYIIFRIIGKVFGAYLGARIMHSVDPIRKYLGISILPQAGVALGMAYQARVDFESDGVTILIVVLVATLFYALIGPIGVKYALHKANEINV